MLLLMCIGLFTSRVVLQALGIEDYGVYGAVGGLVMLFTVLTNSVSQSISRYITWHLGTGSTGKDTLHRVFSTAVLMQFGFCLLLLILTETLGIWWLEHKMNIPVGRTEVAHWVLQCSMAVLMVNLLSVPFNATIISHERMDVFAWISIGEALLKLAVALLLMLSPSDKLKTYAVLMLVVAVLVRLAYGITCRRLFPETRGKTCFDRSLLKEMTSFAGWNMLGSGAYIVNTQGINQLVNIFFGVAVNGARLVALQVENIIKQFITNFLTALNPQITKSYASGSRDYSFRLVGKGVKISGLILTAIGIPLLLEAPVLLQLWLGKVPEYAVIFTRLTLFCIMADLLFNPLLTLIQADGRVKGYYLVSSAVALLVFVLSWLAFRAGAGAYVPYLFFVAVYLLVDAIKVLYAKRLTGYPVGMLFKEALLPVTLVLLLSATVPCLCHYLIMSPLWRLAAVFAAELMLMPAACWLFALTDGEKEFCMRKIGRFVPDAPFLRYRYRTLMGRPLHLKRPEAFSEKIQWLKLHDRRPEYVSLSDKASAKRLVAEKIGSGHIIPSIGVWSRAEDINFDLLPERFVLKCTHDSGSVILCKDKSSFDRREAVAALHSALGTRYWRVSREWAYRDIVPQIIAEPFIEDAPGAGLTDYKFFCFNGEPKLLYVSLGLDDHSSARMDFLYPDWTPAPFRRSDYRPFDVLPPRPSGLETMLDMSRSLSEGIPFVRVDFYQVDGKVLFSEMTFYPCGGFMPLETETQDLQMGRLLKLPCDK
ncbi:MAG: hypothetical protein IJU68_07110 [Bacteroidales bacterium]|nr:hypothetical protein [Bacteroidales bacterium]